MATRAAACVFLATSTVILAGCGGGGGSGSGAAPAAISVSPSSLSFDAPTLHTAVPSKAITVSNTGGSALSITQIAISGADAAAFSQTSTCGASVAAGSSCTVTVTFAPSTSGSLNASIAFSTNATNPSVALAGLSHGLVWSNGNWGSQNWN